MMTNSFAYFSKTASREFCCAEEYFIKLHKGKFLKYSLLLAVLPQNRLYPVSLYGKTNLGG